MILANGLAPLLTASQDPVGDLYATKPPASRLPLPWLRQFEGLVPVLRTTRDHSMGSWDEYQTRI